MTVVGIAVNGIALLGAAQVPSYWLLAGTQVPKLQVPSSLRAETGPYTATPRRQAQSRSKS